MSATQISQPAPITDLGDEKLFELCKKYGEQARFWRQKFLGLLPEVYRRKLYEKKGFSSIFEFAKKLAGVSEEQIRLVLNLDKKFEDKPMLKAMLESGEVSINKLSRIVPIATTENQDYWATQIRLLPNRALETLVRDERISASVNSDEDQNVLFKPKNDQKTVHVHMKVQQNFKKANIEIELKFSDQVKERLLELQNKGIDINALLLEFLEKRELEIVQEKEKLAAEIHNQTQPKVSRYIPAKIKKLLQKEYGTKCSIETCQKPSEEVHHTQRFALGKTHDPRFLAPLCKEHHVIAHSIDEKFREKRVAGTTDSISSAFSCASRSVVGMRNRSGVKAVLQIGRR